MKNEELLQRLVKANIQSQTAFLNEVKSIKALGHEEAGVFLVFTLTKGIELERRFDAIRDDIQSEWNSSKGVAYSGVNVILYKKLRALWQEAHDIEKLLRILHSFQQTLTMISDEATKRGVPIAITQLIAYINDTDTERKTWVREMDEHLKAWEGELSASN